MFKKKILIIIILYMCLCLGIYGYFCGNEFSSCSSDWGVFGSYLCGISTFASVILLYLTLSEQKKENHRNWFNDGFNRRIETLSNLYRNNEDIIDEFSAQITEKLEGNIFDSDIAMEKVKKDLSNSLVEFFKTSENVYASCYYHFKSNIKYITDDSSFNNHTKEQYIQELINLQRPELCLVIICLLAFYYEPEFIKQLARYEAFLFFHSNNPYFDLLKDALFQYKKK